MPKDETIFNMLHMSTAPLKVDILVFYNHETTGASALSCMVTANHDGFKWFADNGYYLLGWLPVPSLPLPLPSENPSND